MDIDWYDHEVFRKTSTIARQVFPVEAGIDHPRWRPTLDWLNNAFLAMDRAKKRGGLAFTALYTIPAKKNEVPVNRRLERFRASGATGARGRPLALPGEFRDQRWDALVIANPWIAALFALFVSWFSTGAILFVIWHTDNESPDQHKASVVYSLPFLVLGIYPAFARRQGDLAP